MEKSTMYETKSIKELNVRAKYNLNILAVKKGTDLNPAPGPSYVFKETDHVVVLGKDSDIIFV